MISGSVLKECLRLQEKWNYSAWVPDAVVILIGPNDEMRDGSISRSSPPIRPGSNSSSADGRPKGFIKAYLSLLNQVAENYEGVTVPPKIIHVCGGSLNGLDPCSDIQNANDQFNAGMHHQGKPMVGYYTTIDIRTGMRSMGASMARRTATARAGTTGAMATTMWTGTRCSRRISCRSCDKSCRGKSLII